MGLDCLQVVKRILMESYLSLLKRSSVAKVGVLIFCIAFAYLATGIEVKAQLQPPCVDSIPFCPCVLADGSCMDIDTPIDNEVYVLVIAALLFGLCKLHLKRVN